MPPEQAVQLYTGNHWHVEAAILAEVQHFTTFAVRSIPTISLILIYMPRGNSTLRGAPGTAKFPGNGCSGCMPQDAPLRPLPPQAEDLPQVWGTVRNGVPGRAMHEGKV